MEKDLLATMGEAEDVGRVELQSLSGDAALPTPVVDRVEWRRVETGSRPWRTERVGFGALSGAGRLSTEIAGLRMRWRGQLGLSWRRRLREARSKNRTVKFKNKMLTTVQTTSVTSQKVRLGRVVPH